VISITAECCIFVHFVIKFEMTNKQTDKLTLWFIYIYIYEEFRCKSL